MIEPPGPGRTRWKRWVRDYPRPGSITPMWFDVVDDGEMLGISRSTLTRLLIEAGYEPEPSQSGHQRDGGDAPGSS